MRERQLPEYLISIIEDVHKDNLSNIFISGSLISMGITMVSFSLPAFLNGNINLLNSLLFWGGAISFSTGCSFAHCIFKNNSHRNNLYSAFCKGRNISIKNIPITFLWRILSMGRKLEYNRSNLIQVFLAWDSALEGQSFSFTPTTIKDAIKLGEELGLDKAMDAAAEGVPLEDIFM